MVQFISKLSETSGFLYTPQTNTQKVHHIHKEVHPEKSELEKDKTKASDLVSTLKLIFCQLSGNKQFFLKKCFYW
ncbi:29500_t:CDS:2 [Gigaspora margarita]|uniref:29500_t:CDS:1 n=1 Tax=Gigaspora margarita TaxID=4874 RepID=A0ABN7UQ57_GIGMA|nr:29500_t:CDS:2 [Gigaspora margarita]